MDNRLVVGVDIGGSHISAVLIDLGKKALLPSTFCSKKLDCHADAETLLTGWTTVIQSCIALAKEQTHGIGIAMPGPFDYSSGISLMKAEHKFGSLYEKNIRYELAARLGCSESAILFRNDAEAFLAGEVFCGSAVRSQQALGLTLGTGLGSAWFANGAISDAEIWCAPYCGGIAEDWFSTRWFCSRYQALAGSPVTGVKELATLAADDAVAEKVFAEFGKNLSSFLESITEGRTCDAIVLGGNIANAAYLFLPAMKQRLCQDIYSTIRISVLGEEATMVGAAILHNQVPMTA